MKPVLRAPTRKARLLVVVLIAISAPLWLFLRGWFGMRALLVILAAGLAAPYVMSFLDVLTTGHRPSPPFTTMITQRYYIPEVLIAGCIWQAVLALVSALAVTGLRLRPPHRGFAGAFVLTPATSPRLPWDLLVVAAFTALLYYGLTVPPLPFELPRALAELPHAQMLAAGFTIPAQPPLVFPWPMIVCYVVLVVDAQFHHGLLRYFDEGERPAAPEPRSRPTAPVVASLQRMPRSASEDLAAVFSRRHVALKALVDPSTPRAG